MCFSLLSQNGHIKIEQSSHSNTTVAWSHLSKAERVFSVAVTCTQTVLVFSWLMQSLRSPATHSIALAQKGEAKFLSLIPMQQVDGDPGTLTWLGSDWGDRMTLEFWRVWQEGLFLQCLMFRSLCKHYPWCGGNAKYMFGLCDALFCLDVDNHLDVWPYNDIITIIVIVWCFNFARHTGSPIRNVQTG